METPEYFNLIVAPETIRIRGAIWLRSAIVAAFIGVIALFCTAPVSKAPGEQDKPVPIPASMEAPPAAQ